MVYPIPTQWHFLTPLGNKPFENTVGNGEIARYEIAGIFVKFEIVVCKLFQFGSLKFVV